MKNLGNQLRKWVNKKTDNRGSSFVLVMVSIALIMVLVAIIFVMIFMQFKILSLGKQSKDNFYYLEEVLEEVRAGVGNESIKQLKIAYDETVKMVVLYDNDEQKYMSVSDETATGIMNNKFFDNIEETYAVGSTELQKLLMGYVLNVESNGDGSYATTDGVTITFADDFDLVKNESDNPKQTIGYSIKGLTVSRVDEKGNEQSISTDIAITPPEEALNFLGSGTDIENIFTYAMVADYGIEVSGGSSTNVRINGNVYAASDRRNNGIYHGDITSQGDNKYTIENSQSLSSDTVNSKYSGIFVTGKYTSLNLQSDIVAVNGSIASNDGATINTNTKSDESSRTSMAQLWAENLTVLGDVDERDDDASQSEDDYGKISVKAVTNLSDDIELNADYGQITLDGQLYAYNNATQEEFASSVDDDDSSYMNKGRAHTNSSAVIINGEHSVLDLSKLTYMIVNGASYIDLVSESTSASESKNTNVDVKTAESISSKGTQLVYRVVESGAVNTYFKSLDTVTTSDSGTSSGGQKVAGTQTLTNRVATYDMIKFLTWRFFKDKGYTIYQKTYGVTGNASDWDSYSSLSDWQKVYNKIMAITNENSDGMKYYKDIMAVYFPTDTIIDYDTGSHKFVKKSRNWDPSDEKNTVNINNSNVDAVDYNKNQYTIWRNEGEIKGEYTNQADVHLYGFITVGKDFNKISLVKTLSGDKQDEFYFYQFYDDASMQEFVKDYADYTNAVATVDDVTSTDLFDVDSIVLPDDSATSYTRGLQTAIDADAKNYEIIDPAKDQTIDEVSLAGMYKEKTETAKYHMAYLPKTEPARDASGTLDYTSTLFVSLDDLFANGTRSGASDVFTYTTKQKDISPLSNPDCIAINWNKVKDNEHYVNSGKGTELAGYTGARVWISTDDITIDGNDFSNHKTSGIVLCMGDVTFTNSIEFTGTVIAAGKVYISGNSTFYSDDQLCNGMIQNDTDNMIRTCLGLPEFKVENDDSDTAKSVSSIEYSDLVAFENYVKNAE